MVNAPLEKLQRLRELREQLADREASRPSRWYCGRPDCDGRPHDWWEWRHARSAQHPPGGDWLVWMIRSGRGFGKTRSGAEWVHHRVRHGARRVALVGRSASDIREVMVEGVSGILAVSEPDFRPTYNPSNRRLTWPNGAIATTYSAEEPSNIRGPEHDTAWCDELSSWNDAHKGDRLDTAWNNLMLSLRLEGGDPRCVVTTTPKPNRLTKEISANPTTVLVTGSTYDNLANLAPTFRAQVLAAYEGTRVGRQELMGEMLDDIEGALFTQETIDQNRVVFVDEDE